MIVSFSGSLSGICRVFYLFCAHGAFELKVQYFTALENIVSTQVTTQGV